MMTTHELDGHTKLNNFMSLNPTQISGGGHRKNEDGGDSNEYEDDEYEDDFDSLSKS